MAELQYIYNSATGPRILIENINGYTGMTRFEMKFSLQNNPGANPFYVNLPFYEGSVTLGSNINFNGLSVPYVQDQIYIMGCGNGTKYINETVAPFTSQQRSDTYHMWFNANAGGRVLMHIYYLKFFDANDNVVLNLVPFDDNGTIGLKDINENLFFTNWTGATGTWIGGPVAHIFTIDKSNARFDVTGGTETVEIEAETTWTASTPSFVSVSPSTGDTGTTQVTISCPSYTGATRREDDITFTDNDNYTLTFKARQNGNSAGFSNIYLGDNNLLSNTIYLGDNAVNTIYLGEEIIYSNGPFVGLKAAPQSLALNNLITTANITIRSSENWTITDDSGGWLSYSTTTGGTGKTVVTVTASTTQAERTATITVTSANYSGTIDVTDKALIMPLNEVWYKTDDGNSFAPKSNTYYIDSNENQLTYTESFDSVSGLWKMVFNGNVYGNKGSLYYQTGQNNRLLELWLPYGFVRPNDIFLYGQDTFEKFKGDSPAIVDNGNAVVCLVQDSTNTKDYVVQAVKNATTVTIPEGIIALGGYAFYKLTATTVNLPSTITALTYASFEHTNITTLNCYATTAPTVDSMAWFSVGNNGTLHYPTGSDYSSFYIPGSWTKVGDL